MSDHNEPCGCDESKRLREDSKYLLGIVDNGKQFTLPILKGLDPTFYATLSYEGDLAIAQRIEEIRGRTA
jgi:hypothetical protein